MRSSLCLLILAAGVGIAAEASAIIGRPLTPVSFAGVARRTVRRSAYVGGAAAVGTAAAVATHPSPYYSQPYYSGGTVVYVH